MSQPDPGKGMKKTKKSNIKLRSKIVMRPPKTAPLPAARVSGSSADFDKSTAKRLEKKPMRSNTSEMELSDEDKDKRPGNSIPKPKPVGPRFAGAKVKRKTKTDSDSIDDDKNPFVQPVCDLRDGDVMFPAGKPKEKQNEKSPDGDKQQQLKREAKELRERSKYELVRVESGDKVNLPSPGKYGKSKKPRRSVRVRTKNAEGVWKDKDCSSYFIPEREEEKEKGEKEKEKEREKEKEKEAEKEMEKVVERKEKKSKSKVKEPKVYPKDDFKMEQEVLIVGAELTKDEAALLGKIIARFGLKKVVNHQPGPPQVIKIAARYEVPYKAVTDPLSGYPDEVTAVDMSPEDLRVCMRVIEKLEAKKRRRAERMKDPLYGYAEETSAVGLTEEEERMLEKRVSAAERKRILAEIKRMQDSETDNVLNVEDVSKIWGKMTTEQLMLESKQAASDPLADNLESRDHLFTETVAKTNAALSYFKIMSAEVENLDTCDANEGEEDDGDKPIDFKKMISRRTFSVKDKAKVCDDVFEMFKEREEERKDSNEKNSKDTEKKNSNEKKEEKKNSNEKSTVSAVSKSREPDRKGSKEKEKKRKDDNGASQKTQKRRASEKSRKRVRTKKGKIPKGSYEEA